MKDKIELDQFFDERNIYVLLFSLGHVTQIFSFCIVNLPYCGCHFSNMTFINAEIKYRSPYLMEISWPYYTI